MDAFFFKFFVACGFGIVVENSQKGQRGIDFGLSELKFLNHIQSVSICDLSISEEKVSLLYSGICSLSCMSLLYET